MRYFLAKTDRGTYSIDQFGREKKTVLDGFKDPQALRAIAEMRPGDRVFLNHSGGGAAVVGLVSVVSEPFGSKKLQAHRSRSRISVPARATHHSARDQRIRPVLRLDVGAARTAFDNGCPGIVCRLDEEEQILGARCHVLANAVAGS